MAASQHTVDAFLAAVKNGDIARVKVMLCDKKVGVNDRFKFGKNEGCSALILACHIGHYKLAKFLLDNGANVNIQDDRGWSALKQASFNNHYEVVKLLLDHGAEVNQQNNHGWTALMNACKNGRYEIAQLLLERSADPNIQRKSGRSALMSASEDGRHQEAELLLKFGAKVELRDNDGKTALTYASVGGHSKVVEILITGRAEINSQDNGGLSVLMKACNQKHYNYGTTKLLLERGAEVDLCAKNGWSALMYASNQGHYELVKLLLHHGAAIDIQSAEGQTPLDLAQTSRHSNVVESLEREISVRSTAKQPQRKKHGETMTDMDKPTGVLETNNSHERAVVNDEESTGQIKDEFLSALMCGDINQVKLLLHNERIGINDQLDSNGQSALMIACWKGHIEVAKLLLENGAEVDQQDIKKWSALKKASFENRLEIVELLLEHDASVNLQDDHGWTALMNACRHGHYELAKLLLERDADPNIRRTSGRSALISASVNGRNEIVKLLLEYNAEVNATDYDCGRTALMYASLNGHRGVCDLLINSFEGALIDLQDTKRLQSALMFASDGGHREIVQLLLDHSAQINLLDDEEQSAQLLAKKKEHHEVVKLLQKASVDGKESACVQSDSHKSKEEHIFAKFVKNFRTLAAKFTQPADMKIAFSKSLEEEPSSQLAPQRSMSLPLVSNSQSWKEVQHIPTAVPAIGLYTTNKSYTCDQRGAVLSVNDITVTIPPGAIPEGITAHIEMGVALYGEFEFPDHYQPVSPLLYFCIEEDLELLLPVEYTLPHVITDTSHVELTFAKAHHNVSFFEILHSSNAKFTPSNPLMKEHGYGVLSTKHRCYLCITGTTRIGEDEALESGYCLHTLIKKEDDSKYQILLLCTYFLDTCVEALKISYPEETPEKKGYEHYLSEPFEFESCEDPRLILTPSTSYDGLKIEMKAGNWIKASAVNFWRDGMPRLRRMKLEHEIKIYPPSVTLTAYSNTPGSRNAVIALNVKGMREPRTITVVKKFIVASSASPISSLEQVLDWDNKSDTDLIKIAHFMLEWEEKLCPHLNLTEVDIHDIKDIHKDKPELQRRAVLRKWKEKQGLGATYQNLLKVFMDGNHFECASAIFNVLKR